MFWNKNRKRIIQRVSKFKPGDEITFELSYGTYKGVVVNNDPILRKIAIKRPYDSVKVYPYTGNGHFRNVTVLNPDPTNG